MAISALRSPGAEAPTWLFARRSFTVQPTAKAAGVSITMAQQFHFSKLGMHLKLHAMNAGAARWALKEGPGASRAWADRSILLPPPRGLPASRSQSAPDTTALATHSLPASAQGACEPA